MRGTVISIERISPRDGITEVPVLTARGISWAIRRMARSSITQSMRSMSRHWRRPQS